MEIMDMLFHWVQLVSNMLVIGGYVFLAVAANERSFFDNPRLVRPEGALPRMAVTPLLGLLATRTGHVTGAAENAWRPGTWVEFIQQHHNGVIWFVRGTLGLVVCGLVFSIRRSRGAP